MFPIGAIESDHTKAQARILLNYLARRCQDDDYPDALFVASTWSLQLLYPHLPERLLQRMPSALNSTLVKVHATLVKTERLFVATPEFGMTHPPMVGFNKAQAFYTG